MSCQHYTETQHKHNHPETKKGSFIGVFPLSKPLIFAIEIEVAVLCAATMGPG